MVTVLGIEPSLFFFVGEKRIPTLTTAMLVVGEGIEPSTVSAEQTVQSKCPTMNYDPGGGIRTHLSSNLIFGLNSKLQFLFSPIATLLVNALKLIWREASTINASPGYILVPMERFELSLDSF